MIRPNGMFYETTEDLVFEDVIVPKGFITDGISYKLRIIGLILNKYDPRFIEACIFHDYLTRYDDSDWNKANEVFEKKLPECWQKPLMVTAVKLYGEFKK